MSMNYNTASVSEVKDATTQEYSEVSKLRSKDAVIYYQGLLAQNNLISSESSASISHEAMWMGEEIFQNTLVILAETIPEKSYPRPAVPSEVNICHATYTVTEREVLVAIKGLDPIPPAGGMSSHRDGGIRLGHIYAYSNSSHQRLASSYRPISLLPTIGKVLEKLMTQRLTYHLESTNSLNDRQHGFREGKSVDTAINELLRKIKTARRDGKHVLVLSIDIKGAYDNLQHRAILKSLDASASQVT
ncbi:hypothetical protein AVEN_186336-1 [Araneus ventricosus]|uniref:Reverse transcriptase domain-containing protein n=1 Tax=Araneus ventricosus TaxID=182803 RepID=A0A4Y2QCM9_ARAVE|nr:hypothetical protein AVEN_186336-1 [Araneus ventricosus]